jgi:ribosome biogenesis GTPase
MKQLKGKISLFWGHSGVGKSSILNVMYPDLNLRTGLISSFTDKGTHTTVTSEMLNVKQDTYIIDTPGIREVEPYGVKKENLGHYFPEFLSYINDCKFNTCTHQHEPGCAVIKAVEEDKISLYRYESYLKILGTIEEDIIFK